MRSFQSWANERVPEMMTTFGTLDFETEGCRAGKATRQQEGWLLLRLWQTRPPSPKVSESWTCRACVCAYVCEYAVGCAGRGKVLNKESGLLLSLWCRHCTTL